MLTLTFKETAKMKNAGLTRGSEKEEFPPDPKFSQGVQMEISTKIQARIIFSSFRFSLYGPANRATDSHPTINVLPVR